MRVGWAEAMDFEAALIRDREHPGLGRYPFGTSAPINKCAISFFCSPIQRSSGSIRIPATCRTSVVLSLCRARSPDVPPEIIGPLEVPHFIGCVISNIDEVLCPGVQGLPFLRQVRVSIVNRRHAAHLTAAVI